MAKDIGPQERKRLLGIDAVARGMPWGQVAHEAGVSRFTVINWKKNAAFNAAVEERKRELAREGDLRRAEESPSFDPVRHTLMGKREELARKLVALLEDGSLKAKEQLDVIRECLRVLGYYQNETAKTLIVIGHDEVKSLEQAARTRGHVLAATALPLPERMADVGDAGST